MNRRTYLRVGLFVMSAIVVGGAITFLIGSQRNLVSSKTEYHASFEGVGGLRAAAPVRIAGVDVGTVSSVRLDENGRINVIIAIVDDATHLIREDSVASIGNKGLLGDKLIDVTVGRGEPLPPGGTIATETPVELADYLAEAGAILAEVRGTVENLNTATRPFADEQFGNDVREIASNVATLTRMAKTEDGTFARLLTDPEMAQNVDNTLTNAERATDELARTLRSTRMIMDEVRTGDGTAHELIYGQEGRRLVTNLADATAEVNTLLTEVRTGDGMVHDLVYEDAGGQIIANVTEATADLRTIMEQIAEGRGTLGAIINDPSIYEDVKRLIGDLSRNEILRALVRYSIRNDRSAAPAPVAAPVEAEDEGSDVGPPAPTE
jgi:phospholipid/cholesterol/gamma-HCH transport system substrate-binding protein